MVSLKPQPTLMIYIIFSPYTRWNYCYARFNYISINSWFVIVHSFN